MFTTFSTFSQLCIYNLPEDHPTEEKYSHFNFFVGVFAQQVFVKCNNGDQILSAAIFRICALLEN